MCSLHRWDVRGQQPIAYKVMKHLNQQEQDTVLQINIIGEK